MLDGKVALITGAARGMGRAHALRLASEGADIVALDIAASEPGLDYKLAGSDELEQVRREVEALGRRAVVRQADVRDRQRLDAVVLEALETLGGIDIVVANAGIASMRKPAWEIAEADWQRVIDINLTGVWHTVSSIIPSMIVRGCGGSIIATTSTGGQRGYAGIAAYVSSKHGVEGLVRTLANELGAYSIRVNAVAPTMVDTPLLSAAVRPRSEGLAGELASAPADPPTQLQHLLPVSHVDVDDIANAVAWLASEQARYVTGTTILVDAGHLAKAG